MSHGPITQKTASGLVRSVLFKLTVMVVTRARLEILSQEELFNWLLQFENFRNIKNN